MRIAVLVLDGVFDSGLASALDVLGTANEMRQQVTDPPPAWDVEVVGFSDHAVTGAGHVVPTAPVSEVAPDQWLVPALAEKDPERLISLVSSASHGPARTLLSNACSSGVPVAAACTSTFVLAEAGILNGLRATTSWWLAPAFRQRYTRTTLDETQMLVTDGRVTTAGAAFAQVDLALSLVQARSPMIAALAARYLVIDDRPSQAPFMIPSLLAHNDPLVSAFEQWLRSNLASPLRLTDAARAIGTSERTLQRVVRKVMGCSPVEFAQEARLDQAIHLFQTSDLPADAIARQVGYENASSLRRLLRSRRHVTPSSLRPSKVG
ncbi:helix-turn-helix domain-containing protein [Streptomyces sp. NPDC051133]|uniref:GlxA family transcriptional regulator n=1 Tax=Streptomyces sp. NPDC051133 TaxID=3155521 RepID=UPI00342EE888